VKVYTIGIGNDEIARQIRRPDLLPDEDTLQKIAQLTGGRYYRADNAERFRQIYAEIDKLEKTEAVINKFNQYDELFPWLVSFGLAVLLVEVALGQTVLRRLP
jgi:Ca-activated chloride channel family protein